MPTAVGKAGPGPSEEAELSSATAARRSGGRAQFEIRENAGVRAREHAGIIAKERVRVIARERVRVIARERAQVIARERVRER